MSDKTLVMNIDVLRTLSAVELADKIFYELAQFTDRESLLKWLTARAD
ncbi:MAG: hypothetical protein IK149_01660 [Oscillospiraceae bacterium]|nr:hypothetical protein [Oscillospiraceae bacterium]